MGSDPGHATQKDDREEGDGPDDELDAAGVLKIRQVDRRRVGGAKPPREAKGRGDGRDHDGEHDSERVYQDRLLGNPDDPSRVEDGRLTCRQDDRRHDDGAAPGPGAGPSKALRWSFVIRRSVWLGGHRDPPLFILPPLATAACATVEGWQGAAYHPDR